jgi:hypothetical protein
LLRAEAALFDSLAPDEVETLRRLLQRQLADATDDETWLPAEVLRFRPSGPISGP